MLFGYLLLSRDSCGVLPSGDVFSHEKEGAVSEVDAAVSESAAAPESETLAETAAAAAAAAAPETGVEVGDLLRFDLFDSVQLATPSLISPSPPPLPTAPTPPPPPPLPTIPRVVVEEGDWSEN